MRLCLSISLLVAFIVGITAAASTVPRHDDGVTTAAVTHAGPTDHNVHDSSDPGDHGDPHGDPHADDPTTDHGDTDHGEGDHSENGTGAHGDGHQQRVHVALIEFERVATPLIASCAIVVAILSKVGQYICFLFILLIKVLLYETNTTLVAIIRWSGFSKILTAFNP